MQKVFCIRCLKIKERAKYNHFKTLFIIPIDSSEQADIMLRMATNSQEGNQTVIAQKLDVLIRLIALNTVKDLSFNDQVGFLSSIGLEPRDIAVILGKTPNNVSVALFRLKREGGKKE